MKSDLQIAWNIYKISISNNINIELEWLPGNKMYKLIILVKYLTLTIIGQSKTDFHFGTTNAPFALHKHK
jgi:hypothetical protein